MKRPFGAKPARSCLRLMRWIAANPRSESAVSIFIILCVNKQRRSSARLRKPAVARPGEKPVEDLAPTQLREDESHRNGREQFLRSVDKSAPPQPVLSADAAQLHVADRS